MIQSTLVDYNGLVNGAELQITVNFLESDQVFEVDPAYQILPTDDEIDEGDQETLNTSFVLDFTADAETQSKFVIGTLLKDADNNSFQIDILPSTASRFLTASTDLNDILALNADLEEARKFGNEKYKLQLQIIEFVGQTEVVRSERILTVDFEVKGIEAEVFTPPNFVEEEATPAPEQARPTLSIDRINQFGEVTISFNETMIVP